MIELPSLSVLSWRGGNLGRVGPWRMRAAAKSCWNGRASLKTSVVPLHNVDLLTFKLFLSYRNKIRCFTMAACPCACCYKFSISELGWCMTVEREAKANMLCWCLQDISVQPYTSHVREWQMCSMLIHQFRRLLVAYINSNHERIRSAEYKRVLSSIARHRGAGCSSWLSAIRQLSPSDTSGPCSNCSVA
jgi:hypothetical protein